MSRDCAECQALARSLIQVESERNFLSRRIRSRQPSRAERRRLVRLKTDTYMARELYQNHLATCATNP